jgi:hypothetical protein
MILVVFGGNFHLTFCLLYYI